MVIESLGKNMMKVVLEPDIYEYVNQNHPNLGFVHTFEEDNASRYVKYSVTLPTAHFTIDQSAELT